MSIGYLAIGVVILLLVAVIFMLFKVLDGKKKSEEFIAGQSIRLQIFEDELKEFGKSMQSFSEGMQQLANRQQNFGEQFREFEREYREADAAARKELRDTQTQVFAIMNKSQKDSFEQLDKSQKDSFAQLDKTQKEAFAIIDKTQKESLAQLEKSQRESFELIEKAQRESNLQLEKSQRESFAQLEKSQRSSLEQFDKTQKESLERLDKTQNQLIKSTDDRLENIRITVAEKLDKTLTERLGKSFETVGKQLNEVQQGLGEMKNLAQDVGGLKKVLSNVKMRGGLGEIQLQMLLENILAPDQYSANVITRKGSRDVVEFAVKLPGSSDEIPNIWLPIDAKFPKDVYEKLQNAYDLADPVAVEAAQKELDAAIKLNAKEISNKYVEPPYTTNFAIMFLPFEGIYAEVVRKAELLEQIQRQYNVIITGPTTLAAILNSLQIGFKTLAIQKRSSEVWETLGAVKTEFDTFGGLLDKAKNKIQGGLNDMDTLIGTRTRAIQRKLRSVESLEPEESRKLLGSNSEVPTV